MGMISPFLDLTIRVGCHLTYEATAPTPVVFMLRPRLDDAHLVTVEERSFEPGLPSNEFQDSHGNLACRSMLKSGRNDIRYDALVAVSSTPENQGAPGVLPVQVMRLVSRNFLRGRLCESPQWQGACKSCCGPHAQHASAIGRDATLRGGTVLHPFGCDVIHSNAPVYALGRMSLPADRYADAAG